MARGGEGCGADPEELLGEDPGVEGGGNGFVEYAHGGGGG